MIRVAFKSAFVLSEQAELDLKNEVIEEKDFNFDSKRRILMKHFQKSWNKGLVNWQ